MTASPAAQPAATPNERLMRLAPEAVGDWKLESLRGSRPGPDGASKPAAEAEYRRQEVVVSMVVAQSALGRPTAAPAPNERTTVEGTEKVYAEGGAAVRETVRRIDGRVDVALARADGVTVTVQGFGVSAADLKALALAVKPLN